MQTSRDSTLERHGYWKHMETYGYCKRIEDPLHQMIHWSERIRGGLTVQSTAVLALYRGRERDRERYIWALETYGNIWVLQKNGRSPASDDALE